LETISKDKDLKKALGVQQKVVEILATEVGKKKECDECIKKLEKLKKGFEETRTGELISDAIKSFRDKQGKLQR